MRCYIEILHIQPIKINVTVLPSLAMRDSETSSNMFLRITGLGLNLVDLHDIPLKINAMIMKDAFMRPDQLIKQISRYMMFQTVYDIYKILGNVDVIGTPVKLGSSIITGHFF